MLISFKIDWFELLAVYSRDSQESSPASQFEGISSSALSFFYCPALILYMTTGETIALTIWNFVGKVMSLLFNTLCGFVIAFLPRIKRLLISWLQSPSAVILGIPSKKVSHCFHYFPIYLPRSDGTVTSDHPSRSLWIYCHHGCHDLSFLNVEF